ncbi:hypothetical protein [Paraburkholderia aspalathi]|uniref:hypothetical protein n=1 Tax=Paraburkholderia aspalathi TaxID=1324617 RepID=UPI001B22D347|nr:hypothetical protein [Paraburkholderia aspalathi]CAE6737786.1 hypothetical protein R20943_02269 [Paraburkholderia aspalathi]
MTTHEHEKAALASLVRNRLGLTLSVDQVETLYEGYQLLSTMLHSVEHDMPPSVEPVGQFTAR